MQIFVAEHSDRISSVHSHYLSMVIMLWLTGVYSISGTWHCLWALFMTNLLYWEHELLWGNTDHWSHKMTSYISRHDGLLATLMTNDATTHQMLINNLRRQDDIFYTSNLIDTHKLLTWNSERHFKLCKQHQSPWVNLKMLWAPCQQSSQEIAPYDTDWWWTLAFPWYRRVKYHGPQYFSAWDWRWAVRTFPETSCHICFFFWRGGCFQISSTADEHVGLG